MFKNQVLEHKASGERIRILDLDPKTETVWTFLVSQPKALPKPYDRLEFEEAIQAKMFVPLEVGPVATLRKPSAAAIVRRDAAFNCIAPLIQSSDILTPSKRSALVKARAEELSYSEQTIYKYLRAWWREGQSRNSLLPNFDRIGSQSGTTGHRGRPPKYENRPIYQMGAEDLDHIKAGLKKHYLSNEAETLDGAYQKLLEDCYTYIDSEGKTIINAPGERPSEAQYLRFVTKHLSKEMAIRARKGDVHFELNHDDKLGSVIAATYTVGDRFEIDATIVDVLIVFSADRRRIIGKPTLYLIRDTKSGLIVGFYVGLENPSWMAAMQAIQSISEDKEALCRRHGVRYCPEQWPAHRVFPKSFVADRGPEMLSGNSERITEYLEIPVINLPTGKANWKPVVEVGFKQIQRPLAGSVPGYTPPENFGKRQTRDVSKDAALTLNDFTKIVVEAIIKVNVTPRARNTTEPSVILADVQPTPINIWDTEIRARAGLLTQYSEEQVRFALLPRKEATVTREGIKLGDCFFSAPEAEESGWFVKAGSGSFKVTVSYDRRLVDHIYVHDEREEQGYFRASLLEKCQRFTGMSFGEVEALAFATKALKAEGKHLKRQITSDFHSKIEPTIRAATQATQAVTKGKSRTSRKKDIAATRTEERAIERQRVAAMPPTTPLPATATATEAVPGTSQNTNAFKSRQQKYKELLDGE